MRWLTFFCILLCVSLFQSTLMNWINLGLAVPDLYFPLILFYSFLSDFKQNTIANWFTGMAKDLFSEGGFGINSILFVAVGFFIWSVRGILYRGHLITQVLSAFIFSIIYNILYAAHISLSFHSLNFSTTLWVIFICSFYTAVLAPLMFWIFSKFQPTQMLFSIRDK
ncbi:MAG: rod shape-determining protein MreD [Planctomycetota bacterium]|nr:rod shape-determining protein MreD [Planctomycetota bacterium]